MAIKPEHHTVFNLFFSDLSKVTGKPVDYSDQTMEELSNDAEMQDMALSDLLAKKRPELIKQIHYRNM